jgi:UDP-2,3-diacylglucosamine pyrophosphatase LpxH
VAEPVSGAPPADLVVLSDLHLGRGKNPATKRWHRLEAFLYDEDFLGFCRWVCREQQGRGVPLRLVLNGDVFDFLRIEPDGAGPARGVPAFGPLLTPALAARMARDVLEGHRAFADGLAEVLAAGHEVVLVPGNHDLELQWEPVQEAVRHALAARLEALGAPPGAVAGLSFVPWFLHEPGRIWIEHGCQYDPENAFRFPLRRGLAEGPLAAIVAERDMPLGNFFQRYLYNAFGNITFIVPSTRANYRYFRFLLANRPRLLLRVAFSHGRFLVQVLRRLARLPSLGWQEDAELAHRAELDRLARASGLGDRLGAVDALKFTRADAARAASGMLRQLAKLVGGALLVAFGALLLVTAANAAIDSLQFGFGLRTAASLALWLVVGSLGLVGLVAAALRLPGDEAPRPLRQAAERVAALVDVPLVTFGHSHEEVVAPLSRKGGEPGWYFNTGTWLAVFTHDDFLPRERVQLTFLRVRGLEAELLYWSPGRDRPMPVVLLEDDEPDAGLPPPV